MSDSKQPVVVAIMVSWNLKERVLEGVAALIEDATVSRVILVDNASSDGTPDEVAKRFRDIEIIRNAENIGYAGGNNVGIRRALEIGADYVFLLNSDATPEPGAIRALVSAAIEEKAGAVGGKPVKRSDPTRIDAAWGVINWRNMASRLEGENAVDGPEWSKRRQVDYPLGVALLLSISALREVGLFDEDYFAYHEEMELCERLRRGGWPVMFEPARFLHGGSESVKASGANLGREYLLARNSARFVKKYGDLGRKIKFRFFVAAASILKLPVEAARGRLDAHLARIDGWMDGMTDAPFDRSKLRKYGL